MLLWTYSHDKDRAHEVIVIGCSSYVILNAHTGAIVNAGALNVKSGTIPTRTDNVSQINYE